MSFTSRLEGLLQNVGLGGVVGEVRARLGYAREAAPARRNEVVRHAPPPPPVAAVPVPVPARTVIERTPRPRPLSEAVAEVEAIAPQERAKAKKARAPKKSTASKARSKPKKAARSASAAATPQDASVAVSRLVEALRAHPRHEALISAGKQKDQLVRSLIPLYLARAVDADVEVTSGTTSRFWGELGVTYAAPNAAKALRLHGGYAQDTKKGKAITARGVQYVEEALERLREPASR